MLSLFPLIHQALIMPLPECSSTQHHAAHSFTSFMAFLKCHLLYEVIPSHLTENCNSLPSYTLPPFLGLFYSIVSSCCLLTYILLSIVEVLRVQGFLFLLYPQCLEQCLTQKRHQINIPKRMNKERMNKVFTVHDKYISKHLYLEQ